MTERVLTNAKVILPDRVVDGTVAIRDGLVTEVTEGPSGLAAAIDCDGDYLAPGFVELHTDNLDRHVTPRPNSAWPVAAAVISHDREIAAAGITTVLNALSVGHISSESRRVETLTDMCAATADARASGHLRSDHYLHLRCEVGYGNVVGLLEPLIDMPLVKLLSVMDHTPGQRQFVSLEHYASFYQGKYKLSDEELETFIEERLREQSLYGDDNRRKIVAMAKERAIGVASHDDATLEHVAEAVSDGIVVAEFPTTMEAARASHENRLAVLMGGPNVVRGKSHSGNISARELAEARILDIVSSDYVPSSLLLAALVLEETFDTITLPDAIAMISTTPARQIGLTDRGSIETGKRADLVRFTRAGTHPVIREVWRQGDRVA